jgi:colicin import membrane protein
LEVSKMAPATTNNRESSVLFSLNELLLLERQRVEEEAAARAAARAAQLEREEAAERQRSEQKAAQQRLAEETKRADELRARAERARVEALRQAERDRVLHEVKQKARLAELALVHEHEQKLARLRRESSTKRLKWAAAGVTCALLLVTAGGAAAFNRYVTQSEAEKVALARAQLDAEREGRLRTEQLERELNRLNAERGDTRQSEAPAAPIDPGRPPKVIAPPKSSRPVPPRRPEPPPKKKECDEFDPMCGL